MNHLTPDQIYNAAFEPQTLADAAAAAHLATCTTCQAEIDSLRPLVQELDLARRSAPSPAAMARYAQLFAQVQTRGTLAGRLLETVRAALRWDSRQQPILQGVRSGAAVAYRQLYATASAELEIHVEPQQHLFRLQGELMAVDEAQQLAPALVQLAGEAARLHVTESDADGRFAFAGLARGRYRLTVTPAQGDGLEIDALEIG
jgi:hypothetical protein